MSSEESQAARPPTVRINGSADGTVVLLDLSGDWRFRDGIPDVESICERVSALPAQRTVRFSAASLGAWDSGLLVFLRRIQRCCDHHECQMDLAGLPQGVRSLIAMASDKRQPKGAVVAKGRHRILARLGLMAHSVWDSVREMVAFNGEVCLSLGRLVRGRAQFRGSDLFLLMQETGVSALPIVTLIGVLVGTILSFLGSIQLRMFGAEIYIANLVSIGMTREMGSLMTGIIMAGRTGASFAAQLGTMQVNEEIDALKTMGFSPMDFLVLPRMLALILMMPLLTIYSDFMGIIGGTIVGTWMLDLTPLQYFTQAKSGLGLDDIGAGLVKSSVYGVAVALAGCMHGIKCGRSASAVGDATTAAVVTGIVAIIIWDSILSVLFVQTGF